MAIAVTSILMIMALWVISASAIYCAGIGRQDLFIWPFDQWLQAAPYWRNNWWITLWVVVSAGVPSIILVLTLIMAVLIWRRWFRSGGPRKPFGGGVRPLVQGATDNFGSATILTDRECLRRFPGPEGVVIGELRTGIPGTAPLAIDPISEGAGHSAVFVGTGGGKSTSAVTTMLHWPGAAVMLDPSAEVGAMLQPALEADGKRVILMNPGVSNSGFNALAWIDPRKPLAGADVRSMIQWIFPPEDGANVKSDGYFEPTGKALCAAILADLIWSDCPPSEKTLKTFRKRVVTPENLMPKALATIHSRSNSPMARDIAGSLMKMTPKQFSGVYGSACAGTEFLSDPDLAELVSGNSFHVRDILDGRTVVFAQIPLRALKPSPGVGRVIVGSLMSAMYDGGREANGRVLVCLDEAHCLGKMNILEDALVVGRKYGIVLQYLYQSTAQAKRIWGDDGIITLYNNLAWRGYAAVRDDVTAELVSKEFGEISVVSYGRNAGTQRRAMTLWGSRSQGDTENEIRRRLALPQEIKEAAWDELFVVSAYGNMRLRMPLYFRRQELVNIVEQSRFSGTSRRVLAGHSLSSR